MPSGWKKARRFLKLVESAEPVRKDRRCLREWGILAAILLALGGYTGYFLSLDHQRISAEEQARLVGIADVIEKNLSRQLVSVDRSLSVLIEALALIRA